MEENKLFYTPDLEEFCINFEYEILETKSVYDNDWKFNVKKLVFNKETIKTNFQLFDILHYYNQKQLRVKYLDQQDIESLGFVYQKNNTYYLNKDKWFIRLEKSHRVDLVELELRYDKIILLKKVFKIKNILELKKLLNQLLYHG